MTTAQVTTRLVTAPAASTPVATTPLVTVTPAAGRLLAERCRRRGPQVLVVTCWSRPGLVTIHDAGDFRAGTAYTELSKIAGWRVYADVDGCTSSPHDRLVIEVRHDTAGRPVLVARGESEGERQDRVLRGWVHGASSRSS